MHGGGGTFDSQRHAVIELLKFRHFVAVAHGLAHESNYNARIEKQKARREGTRTGP